MVVNVPGNDEDGLSNRIKSLPAPVTDGSSPELEIGIDISGGRVAQNLSLVDGKCLVEDLNLPALGICILTLP